MTIEHIHIQARIQGFFYAKIFEKTLNPLSHSHGLKRAKYINSEEQTLPWIPHISVNQISVYS